MVKLCFTAQEREIQAGIIYDVYLVPCLVSTFYISFCKGMPEMVGRGSGCPWMITKCLAWRTPWCYMFVPFFGSMSDSVVSNSRRQIAIAGAKNIRGVSLTPLINPCTKAFNMAIIGYYAVCCSRLIRFISLRTSL